MVLIFDAQEEALFQDLTVEEIPQLRDTSMRDVRRYSMSSALDPGLERYAVAIPAAFIGIETFVLVGLVLMPFSFIKVSHWVGFSRNALLIVTLLAFIAGMTTFIWLWQWARRCYESGRRSPPRRLLVVLGASIVSWLLFALANFFVTPDSITAGLISSRALAGGLGVQVIGFVYVALRR